MPCRDTKPLFRQRRNRICVNFAGFGLVPLADELDDVPVFETAPPNQIGDDAIIYVEGQRRHVRFLRSSKMVRNSTYLVDFGKAFTLRDD